MHKAGELSEIFPLFFFCLFPEDDTPCVSSIRYTRKRKSGAMPALLCLAWSGSLSACHVILFVKVEARLPKALMRPPQRKLINFSGMAGVFFVFGLNLVLVLDFGFQLNWIEPDLC